jgi:MFS family permease
MTSLGRDPAFLRLWVAESVSKMGDAVTMVAVPLVAIAVLDAGPADLAALGVAQLVPVVALALPAGAWVDRRRSPRRVMAAADLLRALVIATVPVAAIVDRLSLAHLWAALFLAATLGTLFDLAYASYVPRIVARNDLVTANARLETSRSAALVAGPGSAAALIGLLSAPFALVIDAVSFLVSGLLLATSADRGLVAPAAPTAQRRRRDELLDGVRFALREPHLRAITATAMTNNLSRSMAMVVTVLYLVDVAGVDPAGVALGFALGNSGFVVGAIVASRMSRRYGVGRTMRFGVSCFWPGMLLLAVAPTALALPAFVVMVFLNGLGIAVHNVNQVSVRQAVTPDPLRARVTAASRLLIFGALPAGTLLGGLLGEAIGLRPTIFLAAGGLFAGSLPYRLTLVGRLQGLPIPRPA